MDRINAWATVVVLKLQDLKNREQGQGLVEYGLILSLVSVVAVLALTKVGDSVTKILDKVATDI